MARRSTSTTPCGAPPVFSTFRTCASVDVLGAGARAFLRRLLANDVDKLKTPGKALYSCMLNDAGGIVDDLIAYYLDESHFRLVVNAGTRDRDLVWIREHASGVRRRRSASAPISRCSPCRVRMHASVSRNCSTPMPATRR